MLMLVMIRFPNFWNSQDFLNKCIWSRQPLQFHAALDNIQLNYIDDSRMVSISGKFLLVSHNSIDLSHPDCHSVNMRTCVDSNCHL